MERGTLLVLGAGPGSGKTILAQAICRVLSDAGVSVAPFKAVSVVASTVTDPDYGGARRLAADHLLRAARIDLPDLVQPFIFQLTAPDEQWNVGLSGSLVGRDGIVATGTLITEDNVSLRDISQSTQSQLVGTLAACLNSLRERYAWLIMEGAGSASDGIGELDLANVEAWRIVECPIVLVGRLSRGAAGASLIGTALCLPEAMRRALVGFVLADVTDDAHRDRTVRAVEQHTGIPYLGDVPHLDAWDGPPDTYPDAERACALWASAVRDHVRLRDLGIVS